MNKWLKILLSFSIVLWFSGITAQTIVVVSAEDNRPIPGARLTLKPIGDEKRHNFTTDSDGKVDLSEAKLDKSERYMTAISFVGFESIRDTISLNKERLLFQMNSTFSVYDEVVVTAQYKQQRADQSVHQVSIIDKEKIENMAAQNLKDVLTNQLNVRLSEDNVLGSSMQLQGIGGQNVKILIDGVPLTGRLNGNIDISQIPMDNVERIEIIEGPLSVSYGTDALAGTINIITKKKEEKGFSISSDNYYESNGRYNNTGSISFRKNKHQLSLEGGRYFFDGWNPYHAPFFVENKPIADSSRVKQWNPKEQFFGTFKYGYEFKKMQLQFSSSNFHEEVINRGAPRPPYEQTAFDDYYQTIRLNQRLNLNGEIGKNHRFTVIGAYNGYQRKKNTYLRDLTTIEDVLSSNPEDQDTSAFHTFISRGNIVRAKDSAKINCELGYDVSYETAVGKRIKDGQQSIGDYALYATAEYSPIQRLTLRPGLRWAYNTTYEAPLVPSFHTKFNLLEKKNHKMQLRASYARGFRAPSIKELHFFFVDINHNIQGNPDLKAETSNNFNVSWSQQLRKNKHRLTNKVSLFYNDISNLITLSQASQTEFSYFNLERYKTTGVQLRSQYSRNSVQLGVGAGYVGRYNQISEEYADQDAFLFSPEVQGNLQYQWKKAKMSFSLFYKYTGQLPNIRTDENGDLYESVIQDYHLADFTIEKRLFKEKFSLSIGAKNLFNVTNVAGSSAGGVAHSGTGTSINVGMGRTYFMRVKLFFKTKK
ncbi:MAG: TonB-dependent receptor [Brumimicrobium sp.]